MSLNVNNFRDEASKFLYDRLSTSRNVLIDAPPGIGKTYSGAKVGLQLRNNGHRVLIVEPTKTLRTQVVEYIKKEQQNAQVHESRGWNDYACPIIKMNADPALCSVRKDLCREEMQGCGVLKDIDRTRESSLTVATFAKMLLSKGMFSNYDVVIIDESHGFENAETTFLQSHVLIRKIEKVAKDVFQEYPSLAVKLTTLAKGLTRMQEMVGESSLLSPQDIAMVSEAVGDEALKTASLDFVRTARFPTYRTLYTNLSSLHFRMQNIYNNVFFFYEGGLYGRPKNMAVEVSNFLRNKNVALLSATVDDPISHARACGVDLRRFDTSDSAILSDYPQIRRENRLLISITDGPSLSRSSLGEYESARKRANDIIYRLLKSNSVRSLVLFRGYNDHAAASSYLLTTDIKERILNIEQGEDPDSIDDKIQQLRKSRNVILSSASTRLWEGVDIPELRLVIIDALPYPGKDPLDTEYDFRSGYRIMVKKLRQGLGRVVRSDSDWGSAVVIDKRFDSRFETISEKLPWHMGDDFKRISVEQTIAEISSFFARRASE